MFKSKFYLFLINNLEVVKLLLHLVLVLIFTESSFINDFYTGCSPEKPPIEEAANITQMKEETVKEFDNMTGQVKIVKKEFVDPNNEECITVCRQISRLGLTVDEDCSVICGANKKQIADTLVNETKKPYINNYPKIVWLVKYLTTYQNQTIQIKNQNLKLFQIIL